MANHCWNWSCFSGAEADLKRMVDNINKAKDLSENKYLWYQTYFTALGQEVPEQELKSYEEFGSRWFDCDLEVNDGFVYITGSSAWSPVSEFFCKLSKAYNLEVESEYEEPGFDFGGFFKAERGKVTEDRTMTYYQYRYECDGLETILNDVDAYEFESIDEAIKSFSNVKEIVTEKEWESILEQIKSVFEDTKKQLQ